MLGASAAQATPRDITLAEQWSQRAWRGQAATLAALDQDADTLHADTLRRVATDQLRPEAGFIQDWELMGPLPRWQEEEATKAKLRAGNTGWRPPAASAAATAYLRFAARMHPATQACGLARSTLHAERKRRLWLLLGGAGTTRLWLDGALLWEDGHFRGDYPQRFALAAELSAGRHRLVVERCAAQGSASLLLRIAERGTQSPMRLAKMPEGWRLEQSTTRFRSPRGEARLSGRLRARWLLAATPSKEDQREAAQLLDGLKRVEALQLRATPEAAARMRILRGWLARSPQDPAAWLAQADLLAAGYRPQQALRWLDALLEGKALPDRPRSQPPSALQRTKAESLRARLLALSGWPKAALAAFARAEALAPEACAVLDGAFALARQAGPAHTLAHLEQRRMKFCSHRPAIALEQGREGQASLAALSAEALNRPQGYRGLPALFRYRGEPEAALPWLEAAARHNPSDAQPWLAHASWALDLGRPRFALSSLTEARRLAPQNPQIARLSRLLALSEAADEGLALAANKWPSPGEDSAGFPVVDLVDLAVHSLDAQGLQQRFYQKVIRVQSAEGARQLTRFPIAYSPGRQVISLRLAQVIRGDQKLSLRGTREVALGEPWYRMYYDQRARMLVFPKLEVGDLIELRYRVDDLKRTRVHNERFGILVPLQSDRPTLHKAVHLRLDPALPLKETLVKRGFGEAIQRSESMTGTLRHLRFEATHMPALQTEARAPGLFEQMPYLNISSFASWQAMAAWYTRLIAPQLELDGALKATAERLVRDARSTREKVAKVYAWVLDETRYVALEFGEYGYIPYPVTQVAQRGFGDCKDKASLLIAMLRHLGIEAHHVMIRTRPRGRIATSPPTLLAFDHAIAYVPAIDRFLDGTVQRTGIDELPSSDQGALALIADPKNARILFTPETPPEAHQRTRKITLRFTGRGQPLEAAVEEELRGTEAPALRQAFEATEAREARFAKRLRSQIAGARLVSLDALDIADAERPVTLRYQAELPAPRSEGGVLKVPSSVLNAGVLARFAPTTRRQSALDLGPPSRYIETRRLKFGKGHAAEAPQAISFEGKDLALTRQVQHVKNSLEVTTTLTLKRGRIPARDYVAFRAQAAKVDAALREAITLRKR